MQVSKDDAKIVKVSYCLADLLADVSDIVFIEIGSMLHSHGLAEVIEWLPFLLVHADAEVVFALEVVEHPHNVRVCDQLEEADLSLQAVDVLFLLDDLRPLSVVHATGDLD